MYIDTHVHLADFSSDGKQSIDELLENASLAGLAGVCTADHYEKDVTYIPGREEIFDLDQYFALLGPLREASHVSSVRLYMGIEFGWMPGKEQHYARLVQKYPFDSVILSLHILDGEDPFSDPGIYRHDKKSLYKRYLQKLHDIISICPDFDILAHFDYISRYSPYPERKMYYREMPDEFDALFSKLISCDKCLEINMATIAMLQKCGYQGQDAWPDRDIISAYSKLGGRKISLGSDAHKSTDLGRFFPETAAWLADIGKFELVAYAGRKAVSGNPI